MLNAYPSQSVHCSVAGWKHGQCEDCEGTIGSEELHRCWYIPCCYCRPVVLGRDGLHFFYHTLCGLFWHATGVPFRSHPVRLPEIKWIQYWIVPGLDKRQNIIASVVAPSRYNRWWCQYSAWGTSWSLMGTNDMCMPHASQCCQACVGWGVRRPRCSRQIKGFSIPLK